MGAYLFLQKGSATWIDCIRVCRIRTFFAKGSAGSELCSVGIGLVAEDLFAAALGNEVGFAGQVG